MPTLRIPAATYRLQFSGQFRLADAQALAEYLDDLGISDIYSSPLLQARHGSTHGYDVTDPSHLNTEVGSEQDLEALSGELRRRGMGLLLDIVPNHMAASSENPWWMDVLEDGPGSAYAPFFDIDWQPPRAHLRGRVLLPILGRPYAEALENHELRVAFEHGSFLIQYYETKLPVAPASYASILQLHLEELQQKLGGDHPACRELGGVLAAIAGLAGRSAAGDRRLQREAIKERLRSLYSDSPEVRAFIDDNLRLFNGAKRGSSSLVLLDRLLASQFYVLWYWRAPNAEINYRRFFTITELVGLRVEDPLVFETTHSVLFRLIDNGVVTGLRIDHIDGLNDPLGYLRRLQKRLGDEKPERMHPEFYVIVEKILSKGETIVRDWPACGTTGYDFLNVLNGLFVDEQGRKRLEEICHRFIGSNLSYDDLLYVKKKDVMENLLAAEMRSLGHHLTLLAEDDRYARDLPQAELTRALVETTACFPVYRTYIRSFSVTVSDRQYLKHSIQSARQCDADLPSPVIDFLEDVLLLKERAHVLPEQREARLAFVMRWQQFTGPIMAKAMEDSSFYVYNSLISQNEVGGNPSSPGVAPAEFHQFCQRRQEHSRHALNATSTHDTKRAEDVRARINVLSEIPDLWEECLQQWTHSNESKKKIIDGQPAPDANEEIFLYQTMLGAWPLQPAEVRGFTKRLEEYMNKALREAAAHTRWTSTNVKYERAVAHFVKSLTQKADSNQFLQLFLPFAQKVAHFGALNALSQLLVKITAPGVPDFYQGSELWDLRLVDPDNRGAVDFDQRARVLAELKQQEAGQGLCALLQSLLDQWQDGRIKFYVTAAALKFRRASQKLFLEGAYQPLQAKGERQDNVCAFMRSTKSAWCITAVPRLVTRLVAEGGWPIGHEVWCSSALLLPHDMPEQWQNVLTGETVNIQGGNKSELSLADVFREFPVALLSAGKNFSKRPSQTRSLNSG